MRVGVVDYHAGNLRSVETALRFLGADFFISTEPKPLLAADRLIFPGVGEATSAMQTLTRSGLDEAIRAFFKSGKLVLGICLGSQIVLSRSEEGNARCLDLIPGSARLFPKKAGYKIPHMGWNQVNPRGEPPLFQGIPANASFYFVHSYYAEPEDERHVAAKTDYILQFPSALVRDNLVAVQFHPEKSGKYGLKLLENFLRLKEGEDVGHA
ncbi:MAG TPA: imidazole glycerol phosphate synthase subunit HisH [Spirochaetia bacterium]|nr:imidazole glycerol phosphate synthase subunit HisH [Spirochaetia bacterium]